jgi:hypothetical protein
MRKTIFYRVSGCVNAEGLQTSICVHPDQLARLQKFAYNDVRTLNTAVRNASRDLYTRGQLPTVRSWSQAVVDKALSKLTGAYDPVKAQEFEQARLAAEKLAAENNAAWAEVA